jgi:hypothetical protein
MLHFRFSDDPMRRRSASGCGCTPENETLFIGERRRCGFCCRFPADAANRGDHRQVAGIPRCPCPARRRRHCRERACEKSKRGRDTAETIPSIPAKAGTHASVTRVFRALAMTYKRSCSGAMGPGLRRGGERMSGERFFHTLERGNPAIKVRDCSLDPLSRRRRLLGLVANATGVSKRSPHPAPSRRAF